MGLVIPIGIGVETAWKNVCEGKSGIGLLTRFDTNGFETKIAGEVKHFNPELYIDKKEIKKMDLFIHYAIAATKEALEDAQLAITPENSEQIGVIVGTGLGGLPSIERYHKILLEKGPGRISPFFIPMLIANLASGQIAIQFGPKGPNTCVVTACATGAHCIGDAFRAIVYGDAEAMIAGGTEANITPLTIGGFNSMKALSTRNDEPEKACRPFEKNRDGFVVAEGAGILILEELQFALKRNAKIYGELIGYGYTSDAYHITAPSPDGDGAVRCMRMAIKDARLKPEDVEYINAHGTSTPLNDLTETIAIKKVFGDRAKKIPISATKSMTGHLLGAAGSTEAIFTILAIQDGIIPPTINYEEPDPQCDLDYVPNAARRQPLNIAMSNAFGFGGTNATLVFKKFEG
ncbi:MAG: beta-ketoacyl-[acyl-carrier-protein] synthase II [Deltaproteobacteria bacterium CG_4_8_14_3_um_filter_45_9]|nr:MAG: beta-ketoacyl-[acyl-carrier-protein] synthase II [Deltaproteobacteria bacterium CG_4_8_14_3_um_filter_45_9]